MMAKRTSHAAAGAALVMLTALPVATGYADEDGIQLKGSVRADAFWRQDHAGDYQDFLRLESSDIKVWTNVAKNVELLAQFRLDQDFRANGEDVDDEYDIDNVLKEIRLTFKNIGGSSAFVKVGKHQMPFGQDYRVLPIYNNNVFHGQVEVDKRFGATVGIGGDTKVEASVFENDGSNLSVGEFDNGTVKVSGKIGANGNGSVSYAHFGHKDQPGTGEEKRASAAYKFSDGTREAFVEALYFDNNPRFPAADAALNVGVAHRVGPARMGAEALWIDDTLKMYGVGVNLDVSRHGRVGPEIRYTDNDGAPDRWEFGARFEYRFGKVKPSETTVF